MREMVVGPSPNGNRPLQKRDLGVTFEDNKLNHVCAEAHQSCH